MRSESKIRVTDAASRMVPDCLQIKDCAVSVPSSPENKKEKEKDMENSAVNSVIVTIAESEGFIGLKNKRSSESSIINAGSVEVTVFSGDNSTKAGNEVVGLEESMTAECSSINGPIGGMNGPLEQAETDGADAKRVRELLARFFDSTSQSRNRKRPKYAIRPALQDPPSPGQHRSGGSGGMCREVMVSVFSRLPRKDLQACMLVSRSWNRWCMDSRLWPHLDASHTRRFTEDHLAGIVRRQPASLDLGWSSISGEQLKWLCERLPWLERLCLAGLSWPVVSALRHYMCPPQLKHLDLSYVNGLGDEEVRCLLSGPVDGRPGLVSGQPRLGNLTSLSLRGSKIVDSTLTSISSSLKGLQFLDVSDCYSVTDEGVCNSIESLKKSLTFLSLNGCGKITDKCLPRFESCLELKQLDLGYNPGVTESGLKALVSISKRKFVQEGNKVLKVSPR